MLKKGRFLCINIIQMNVTNFESTNFVYHIIYKVTTVPQINRFDCRSSNFHRVYQFRKTQLNSTKSKKQFTTQ